MTQPKVVAVRRWQLGPDARFATMPTGHRHRWVYRGQVVPGSNEVIEDVYHTTDDEGLLAIKGIGKKKLEEFGELLKEEIEKRIREVVTSLKIMTYDMVASTAHKAYQC